MGIETEGDRAVFVSADDFGAIGVYTSAGGTVSDDIAGIFDRPAIAVEIRDVAAIDSRPTFLCREDDLPDDAEGAAGDEIEITGEGTFQVVSIEPDGQGMVLLRLGALS